MTYEYIQNKCLDFVSKQIIKDRSLYLYDSILIFIYIKWSKEWENQGPGLAYKHQNGKNMGAPLAYSWTRSWRTYIYP